MKRKGRKMNTDTFYSIIFICAFVIYLILAYVQVKRIVRDKNYRRPWIVGIVVLSILVFLLGMITPINIIGTVSSAILLLVLLYLGEKKIIKNREI